MEKQTSETKENITGFQKRLANLKLGCSEEVYCSSCGVGGSKKLLRIFTDKKDTILEMMCEACGCIQYRLISGLTQYDQEIITKSEASYLG